ncbi:hypothetical protein Pfo_020502 [Paulownia fortunei]|nr:hypothetical protein Pfo_020502 [Paulownia fortunei]
MNSDVGGPSHVSSSTYSSSTYSDTDAQIMLELQAIDVEQETLFRMFSNTSLILAHCSIPGHIVINREWEKTDRNLFNDYFAENPRYNEAMFRRRYRMSRSLFLHIVRAVEGHDRYFVQKSDGIGKLGLSTFQKITSILRVLAYGIAADATYEYIKIGESTVIEKVFADRYLRAPNANDVSRLLHLVKQRGFPGMLGSNNDINVLEASHLFANIANGIAPPAHYVIQEKEYDMGYYLADSIYPKWSTIVQTIHDPRDVERAFGVLQSRFAIVARSVRFWKKYILHDIMTTCIIMHNMIIEDERDMVIDENDHFQEFLTRHR